MFDYRIAYGCWLNDSRLDPIDNENWPSVRIDSATIDSLKKTMAFLADAGYNWFDVFGLITNRNWSEDVASTISLERMEAVQQVIDIVHGSGLKLIYGLGVYSWGFDQIIAQNPAVRGTSAQAMCASSPEAERVMKQVVDYLIDTYAIDGYHLEAADQGRCTCDKCAAFESDIDYYNHVNALVAAYIRSRKPEALILVNTSGYLKWGDQFSPSQTNKVLDLCRSVDVFIDVGSHGHFVSDMQDFTRRTSASVGTSNGFWVYPPQRWDRKRWLLPHVQQNHRHLKAIYEAGCRSAELFLSPLSNPGAEITQMCNGLLMQNPSRPLEEILSEAVEKLYAPVDDRQRDQVAALFVSAEDLFFKCWHPQRNRQLPEELSDGVEHLFQWSDQNKDGAIPGELFMEPLFGEGPGIPCYLTVHFDQKGRDSYRLGMQQLLAEAQEIGETGKPGKIGALKACCLQVLRDIEAADGMMKGFSQ